MRRRLVRQRVGPDAAPQQFGQHLGRVAEQSDRQRLAISDRSFDQVQCLVQRVGAAIQVTGLEPLPDTVRLAFHGQHRGARHRRRQRLRAAHAAQARG